MNVLTRWWLPFVLLMALLAAWVIASRSGVPAVSVAPGAREPTFVLPGTVVKVTDGDSIRVRLQSGRMEVRVFGVDAPERQQRNYAAATKLMRSLLGDGRVELEPVLQRDRYDRMVARVFAGDTDVGAAMIAAGFGWAYRSYLRQVEDAEAYCDLEAQARAERRGLWADPPSGWVPPWEFRTRQRGESVAVHDYSAETAADCRAAIGRGGRTAPTATSAAPTQPESAGCRIKGNINSRGERIYHVPGSSSYAATRIDERLGERWFCSEEKAREAGWRAPRRQAPAR